MKYQRKPLVIEAITFKEFVEYGRGDSGPDPSLIPWRFTYQGHHVVHRTNDLFIIEIRNELMRFNPNEVLVTRPDGSLDTMPESSFAEIYEPYPGPEQDCPAAPTSTHGYDERSKTKLVFDELDKCAEQMKGEILNLPTLRDQFAMAALMERLRRDTTFDDAVVNSYRVADAMMERRKK